MPDLAGRWGKRFGDRGYIRHELFERLQKTGVRRITKRKRGMQNKWMPLLDKFLRRKRVLIESVGEQLKPVCPIAHTRYRSLHHASVHTLAALAAYTWYDHKPSLRLSEEVCDLLVN